MTKYIAALILMAMGILIMVFNFWDFIETLSFKSSFLMILGLFLYIVSVSYLITKYNQ